MLKKDNNMATYMLSWNLSSYTVQQCVDEINNTSVGADKLLQWSFLCKSANIGDRVFLYVAEKGNPKKETNSGICATGTIVKKPFFAPHWDGSGKTKRYIQFKIESILNPAIDNLLTRSLLKKHVSNEIRWIFQASGVPLKDEKIAAKLLDVWNDFIKDKNAGTTLDVSGMPVQTELEISNKKDWIVSDTISKIDEKSETEEVFIPEPESVKETSVEENLHTKAQYYLAKLGEKAGCLNHIATNDRSKEIYDEKLDDLSVKKLPQGGIPQSAYNIISRIDNLWLDDESPICAFEIETSTSIYSGLLRMTDLKCVYGAHNIKLYIVAPEEKVQKFRTEIMRPTFKKFNLDQSCAFISIEKLTKFYDRIKDYGEGFTVNYINNIAERFARV